MWYLRSRMDKNLAGQALDTAQGNGLGWRHRITFPFLLRLCLVVHRPNMLHGAYKIMMCVCVHDVSDIRIGAENQSCIGTHYVVVEDGLHPCWNEWTKSSILTSSAMDLDFPCIMCRKWPEPEPLWDSWLAPCCWAQTAGRIPLHKLVKAPMSLAPYSRKEL